MYAETGAFGFVAYSPPPDASSCIYTAALPLIADPPDILGNMAPPSLVSEYDLGGEGDLFKAPEPIIEEPVLSLDPVAAAISMISGSENVMDETIEVEDIGYIQNYPLFSEVIYQCEKELMEKSAIEERISELLDVQIPMVQVEELPRQIEQAMGQVDLPAMQKEKPSVPECSLQKSVSSVCLNSADRINGTPRPNFLDFQGLDFETAFGLRRAYSEGDIQDLGASTPRQGNSANVQASCERLVTASDLKSEERKQKLSRYRKKKVKRNFSRKIKYVCRKALADSQPRVRGRFAKIEESDLRKPRKLRIEGSSRLERNALDLPVPEGAFGF